MGVDCSVGYWQGRAPTESLEPFDGVVVGWAKSREIENRPLKIQQLSDYSEEKKYIEREKSGAIWDTLHALGSSQ